MSKMKKNKRKTITSAVDSVLTALNIPVPEELSVPIMVDLSGLRSIITENSQLKAQMVQMRKTSGSRQKTDINQSPVDLKTCATIATNAWRAQVKMIDSETGEAKDEMKRVYRYIETIIESLKQSGVEIIDPNGLSYDSGMALKVVSFEPTPGLSHEEIKETIKPSVVWQGRLIQIGEVIVGTPETT